jgi:CubicO group peptidase (beta-lactamase class C family)
MKLDDVLDADFQGCVFIRKNGAIRWNRAYGFRDLPNQIPNGPDTRFATASAGKVFVAVAVLQLIEQGRLGFDTPIETLLDFDLKQIDPGITVRQLLTHTSGIPAYFDESVLGDYADLWQDYPNYKIRSPVDLLPLFTNKPMLYDKGARFK